MICLMYKVFLKCGRDGVPGLFVPAAAFVRPVYRKGKRGNIGYIEYIFSEDIMMNVSSNQPKEISHEKFT